MYFPSIVLLLPFPHQDDLHTRMISGLAYFANPAAPAYLADPAAPVPL
ncbi:hypothetical protein GCWU000342_01820 [Shuttleworthella satelles DSM 14600]|uniref:Uncharacterized protein n=1 Tax=Shuttleworthella satelles DSM 14600 TaxID=626523 RepID=C4GCX7_9FIRM|nr:hypothetical protein GCWU000342_01820 [Shuttleworthia satelles DSM 14600]